MAQLPSSELNSLLLSLFAADELRRFVRYLPDDLSAFLPGSNVSPAQLAFAVVDALMKHNLVDAQFFALLLAERPRRKRDIDAVAEAWGVSHPGPEVAPVAVRSLPQRPLYAGPVPAYRSTAIRDQSERLLDLQFALASDAIPQNERRALQREVVELQQSLRPHGGALQAGDTLAGGRYLLVRRLGEGRRGPAFLAHDLRATDDVVLRVLEPPWSQDAARREQFLAAAGRMSSLRHPNITAILDPKIADDEYPGFAMEYMRGGRLVDLVARGALQPRHLWRLLLEVAEALHFAHERSVTHGSVSPTVIELSRQGAASIRDFAVAEAFGSRTVATGDLVFLAPERMAGAPASPASDQYAFAILVAFCLAGGQLPATAVRDPTSSIIALSIPESFRRSLLRAIEPEPEARHPSVLQLAAELHPATFEAHPATTSAPRAGLQNPFSVGTPLSGEDMPPGRDENVQYLLDVIENHGSAALLGPRRSGKTSILRHLQRRLAADHHVRMLNLEGSPCDTPHALAVALEPKLREQASPADALLELLDRERDRWPVLILDELGHLRTASLLASPTVFGWLRAIGQSVASIVYAGSPGDWTQVIALAQHQPGSSFGNDLARHDLGPLSEDAALAFLTRTAPSDAAIPADPTGRWILEYCGTWPFYLQILGQALVAEIRQGRRGVVFDNSAVHELYTRRILIERAQVFASRWQEFPPAVRSVLLANGGELPRYEALTPPQKRLVRDALLYSNLRGGWALADDPPFLEWIRREHDTLFDDLTGQSS